MLHFYFRFIRNLFGKMRWSDRPNMFIPYGVCICLNSNGCFLCLSCICVCVYLLPEGSHTEKQESMYVYEFLVGCATENVH